MDEHKQFRDFELSGWRIVADAYDETLGTLTRQALDRLLDAARAAAGMRLLDVATGPGYGAAAAAHRGARAFGMDFSAPMIARARSRFPGVPFLVGDAEDLPIASDCLGAVICNFGLLHLARPERFLREARRALRSGGRIAFTVWAPPEEAAAFGIVLAAVEQHGTPEVPLPPGPPFFRFSQEEECVQTLEAAGFSDPQVARVRQRWSLPHPDALFQAMVTATVRTGALLRAQPPAALEAIRHAMRRAVRRYRAGDIYDLPMPAVLASAGKP